MNYLKFILMGLVASSSLLSASELDSAKAVTDAEVSEVKPVEAHSGWYHGEPFVYKEGLLNYVGFPRDELSEKGIDIYLSTLSIWQGVTNGGLEEEDVFSTSYDLQIYLDSKKMGLWENGHALIRAEGKTDDIGVNPYTGAIIPVNFDAVVPVAYKTSFELTEWWYAHTLFEGKAEILAGMYDIGRFFDLSPFSGPYPYRFLNAHMFFNSVLLSYAPYNLLGGILILKPTEGLTITTGISDPHSSAVDVDWFNEGDVNLLHEWRFMAHPFTYPTMVTAGVAYTTQDHATIAQPTGATTTVTANDDWAFYANVNQWLYQNPENPHQSIGLFGRIGLTDGEVNIIQRHFSVGVTFDGMIQARPKDGIGIVTWYNSYSDDLASYLDDSSSGLEAYYRFQVTPWFQLTADIQYLNDPGIAGGDDTTVLGLRGLIHY